MKWSINWDFPDIWHPKNGLQVTNWLSRYFVPDGMSIELERRKKM